MREYSSLIFFFIASYGLGRDRLKLLSTTTRSLVVSRTLKPPNRFLRIPKPNAVIDILHALYCANILQYYMIDKLNKIV